LQVLASRREVKFASHSETLLRPRLQIHIALTAVHSGVLLLSPIFAFIWFYVQRSYSKTQMLALNIGCELWHVIWISTPKSHH